MKKKIIAAFAAAAVLLAAGCGNSAPAETTTAAPAATTTAAEQTTTIDQTDETEEEEEEAEALDGEADNKGVKGFTMKVSGLDGKMTITRAPRRSISMGNAGKWTIFVYLCGTDLESVDDKGAASGDVEQMISAAASDKVRFVVQTGGTSEWMNEMFRNDACERYLVENGDINLVDTAALTSMGDSNTLSSFLSWGVENYSSEKMGVIMWNHGGGSISGVCADELHDDDALSLSEINTALSKVYSNMTDKFEFIGFDCCLMGTAESANILATYARYFYGSQETEPGCGWNYKAIGDFLAKNPSANGGELGKIVADSFYEESVEIGDSDCVTFSITDLEKFDDFTIAFNDYAKALYETSQKDLAGIVRGVKKADNFGGNNKAEGYTNMVDIGGIINNCSAYADGSAALTALNNCIVYVKNSTDHRNASGLSIYYPLEVSGSDELKTFSGICISPYYLSLVDMVATGYTGNGYDNQVFFTDDGDWECEDCTSEEYDESYFDHAGEGGGKESQLIKFEIEPQQLDDGSFGFQLTKESLEYIAEVNAALYFNKSDDVTVEIGETYDVDADWDEGIFLDNFDGKWLSLPDGQILATYVVSLDDGNAVYTSPIILNGKETNLRIRVDSDGNAIIDGAWDGIGDNGIPAREIKKLKTGDKIVPQYYIENDDDKKVNGDEYSFTEGDKIIYGYLPDGDYEYSFDIEDVYGDYYFTDYADFSIENGEVVFYTGEEEE